MNRRIKVQLKGITDYTLKEKELVVVMSEDDVIEVKQMLQEEVKKQKKESFN